MFRLTVFAAGVFGVALIAPAGATSPTPRHVVVDYVAPTSVRDVAYQDAELQYRDYGSATAMSLKSDRYVVVTAVDRTGLPVPYRLMEDLNGSGTGDVDHGEFCGGRSSKVRIHPGVNIIVYLEVGACPGGPAAATTGTIDFALSAR
jgi:hypothetical protein